MSRWRITQHQAPNSQGILECFDQLDTISACSNCYSRYSDLISGNYDFIWNCLWLLNYSYHVSLWCQCHHCAIWIFQAVISVHLIWTVNEKISFLAHILAIRLTIWNDTFWFKLLNTCIAQVWGFLGGISSFKIFPLSFSFLFSTLQTFLNFSSPLSFSSLFQLSNQAFWGLSLPHFQVLITVFCHFMMLCCRVLRFSSAAF